MQLRPVDSEHSAIWQCLQTANRNELARIIITASGGPFLRTPRDEMANVTVEHALAHPNWSMGSKITIDSATMMNKWLEVIEAHHLFDIPTSESKRSSIASRSFTRWWSGTTARPSPSSASRI